MSTTLELPDDLMREVTLRAAQEGRDPKETVAQLLRKGLAVAAVESATVGQATEAMLKRRQELPQNSSPASGAWNWRASKPAELTTGSPRGRWISAVGRSGDAHR